MVAMARDDTSTSRPGRRGRAGVATLVCLAVVALGTTATWAGYDGEQPAPRLVRRGLAEVPAPDVERFPRLGPSPVPTADLPEPPRLRLERLDGRLLCEVVPFDAEGAPRAEAFATIAKVFEARGGHQVTIHPRLVEVLITLSHAFDGRPIGLVSGHREAGHHTRKTSYHVKGMAADIAIRGVKVHALRNAAVRLGAGGVGVYPTFVHVDVRDDRPYRWVGGSWHAWRHWRAGRR